MRAPQHRTIHPAYSFHPARRSFFLHVCGKALDHPRMALGRPVLLRLHDGGLARATLLLRCDSCAGLLVCLSVLVRTALDPYSRPGPENLGGSPTLFRAASRLHPASGRVVLLQIPCARNRTGIAFTKIVSPSSLPADPIASARRAHFFLATTRNRR